jgi:Fe-S oxidoreductase
MIVCPWNQLENHLYPIYKFFQRIKLGAIIDSEEKAEIEVDVNEVFKCVGCDACYDTCPRGVNTSDILRAVRRILVDFQSYPDTLKAVVQKIKNVGNPLGETSDERFDWTKELEFSEEADYRYFSCCISAYEYKEKNFNTVKMLQSAGVTLSKGEETCCGEAIRRVGAEEVFEKSANTNITSLNSAKDVIVTSPHCYATFKNEYPELGLKATPIHITQKLDELIQKKKLVPTKPLNKKVVYHDPCTLGRQNGIYDEPRNVLSSIPELELLEVPRYNRESSMCCGAGSGGLWTESETEERIVDVRLKQLIDTGADIIAVACPYCLQMFEETLKSMDSEIEVMDVSDLLYSSL